jgi:hypothetical protein
MVFSGGTLEEMKKNRIEGAMIGFFFVSFSF